jgi:isochorismate hydrolase
LTEEDIESVPPILQRLFLSGDPIEGGSGIGTSIGDIELEDGATVDGGRLMMRDAWNMALYPPSKATYREVLRYSPADKIFYKPGFSGTTSYATPCTNILEERGIRTLLLAGIQTRQNVFAKLHDAVQRDNNCVLLEDACEPNGAAESEGTMATQYASSWGFLYSCAELFKAVEKTE